MFIGISASNANVDVVLKQSLNTYTSTHLDEKGCACGFCNKKFNQMNHLKRYFFTHTEEIPFKCIKCDSVTNEKYHLQRNILVHTGEKCYKCHLSD